MANADRISEVYRGEHGQPELRSRSRERIHWLVAQAHGRVLDLGCSQGITSLLLARAGFEVLGIDYEEDRIASARAELQNRPLAVQERLEFRIGDATALDLPDSSFDTVIFGEVIEHLPDPNAVLREIVRVLTPDGRIVLTTPFGYNPHHDHRHTFYVASLVGMLAPHLTIDSLAIVGNFFRVVARPGAMAEQEATRLILSHQAEQEQAMIGIQDRDTRLKIRYRRKAGRRRKALRATKARRRRERRRLERRLLAYRASRWTRLGRAIAKARRPRGLIAFPREAVRALRKRPVPSPRPPGARRTAPAKPKPRRLRWVAEAGMGAGEPRVDLPQATPLPDGPIARPDLRVATILDRFSALAFRYEWDQVEVTPDDWREVLESDPPDLLFVESAWRGNGDHWAGTLVNRERGQSDAFSELVGWCRNRSIPTVFWGKEDPPRFSEFIESARLFEHVFTTDSNCFGPYQEVLRREEVEVLPFGAQPRVHNPIAVPGGRRHPVAFAGSYIAHRHPERQRQMELLLGPAREFGLHIFARVAPGEAEKFEWPEKYKAHIVGSLPYERMINAYKAYQLFLNVNSVTTSPTMCARRVFELSATATPVLSGHSPALESLFGGEVAIAGTVEEAREHLETVLGDPERAMERAHAAMRHVLREHTYGHRVDRILEVAGISGQPTAGLRDISVVLPATDRETDVFKQLAAQTHRPHEVWLVGDGNGGELESAANAARSAGLDEVFVVSGRAGLAANLDETVQRASGSLSAFVAPQHAYGPGYLEDLAAAFSFSAASVVGKGIADGAEHSYTTKLHPQAFVAETDEVRATGFATSEPDPIAGLLGALAEGGARAYAADRYSFRAAALASS